MANNSYWEQAQGQYLAHLDETKLVEKIGRCERIVGELKKSPVWKILKEDAEDKRQYLDDNWQDITDEKLLNNMRVKKSAVKWLLTLEENYKQELNQTQVELKRRQNQDISVQKDWDNR